MTLMLFLNVTQILISRGWINNLSKIYCMFVVQQVQHWNLTKMYFAWYQWCDWFQKKEAWVEKDVTPTVKSVIGVFCILWSWSSFEWSIILFPSCFIFTDCNAYVFCFSNQESKECLMGNCKLNRKNTCLSANFIRNNYYISNLHLLYVLHTYYRTSLVYTSASFHNLSWVNIVKWVQAEQR